MKLIRITNENINLIAFRLKQFIKLNNTIQMQSTYKTRLLEVSLLGSEDEYGRRITKSQVSHFTSAFIDINVDTRYSKSKEKYIRFTLGSDSAMLINIGDKIKITSTLITLKENKGTLRIINPNGSASPICKISKGNYDLALEYEKISSLYSKEYQHDSNFEF